MKIDSTLVRKLRHDAGWSQEDLATASGLGLRTVQRIETDGVASAGSRTALAAAFDLEPNDLVRSPEPLGPESPRFWYGLLLLWAGFAGMFGLGWGIGLIGVGVIHIVCQLWRTLHKLRAHWVGHAIGAVFVLAGSALLAGREIPTFPVLVISAGFVLMMTAAAPIGAPGDQDSR